MRRLNNPRSLQMSLETRFGPYASNLLRVRQVGSPVASAARRKSVWHARSDTVHPSWRRSVLRGTGTLQQLEFTADQQPLYRPVAWIHRSGSAGLARLACLVGTVRRLGPVGISALPQPPHSPRAPSSKTIIHPSSASNRWNAQPARRGRRGAGGFVVAGPTQHIKGEKPSAASAGLDHLITAMRPISSARGDVVIASVPSFQGQPC